MISDYHDLEIRVSYADTDQMGVVYYANYLIYFERGRTELLRNRGFNYRDLEKEEKIFLPVAEVFCEYRSFARYDDLLKIRTRIKEMKRASLVFHYEIFRLPGFHENESKPLVIGETKHAFINTSGKPVEIPKQLRDLFAEGTVNL